MMKTSIAFLSILLTFAELEVIAASPSGTRQPKDTRIPGRRSLSVFHSIMADSDVDGVTGDLEFDTAKHRGSSKRSSGSSKRSSSSSKRSSSSSKRSSSISSYCPFEKKAVEQRNGKFKVCVSTDSKDCGELTHFVSTLETCDEGEKEIQWNKVGPKGDMGPQGPEGPQGEIGPIGPEGPQGLKGDQGAQGAQGEIGPIGTEGPQGFKGDQGAPGAQGEIGPMGPEGPQGLKGDQGVQGVQGKIGPMGPEGPQGLKGDQGAQGAQGEIGPSGPKGQEGPQGPEGPRGPEGVYPDKFSDFCANLRALGLGAACQKYVFVSSEKFNGNVGGVAGADAHCQRMADAASLAGTYNAWISTSAANAPVVRFKRSTLPYAVIDNTIIANDWDDLVDGDLRNWAKLDEYGRTVGRTRGAMTSTRKDGTFLDDPRSCSGYTSSNGLGTAAPMEGNNPLGINGLINCKDGDTKLICVQQ